MLRKEYGKMIVGSREESVEEKRKRHMKEMKDENEGWRRELENAIKRNDNKFAEYCKLMIDITENTYNALEKYEII